MKYYSKGLINKTQKKGIKRFFLGSAPENYYYHAEHHTEPIYLLWVESARFGKAFAFPCVLEEGDGEPMVFFTGADLAGKVKNAEMVRRWNLFVTPESIATDYAVQELDGVEFQSIYGKYKNEARNRQAIESNPVQEPEVLDAETLPALDAPEMDAAAADAPKAAVAATALDVDTSAPDAPALDATADDAASDDTDSDDD